VAGLNVRLAAVAAERDGRDVALGPELLHQLPPVQVGQAEVADHQRDVVEANGERCGRRRRRVDIKSLFL